jgi:GNAT superfamily N-acetyltransferase
MLAVAQISLSEHAKEVQELWQRNLHGMSRGDPSDKLRLGYLENPAGDGAGLGLRSDEAEGLFGVICLHPRNMYRGELRLRTVNLADFAVEPKYRTLGPALMLMKAAVSLAGERGALMYGLPNRTSAAVCRRAGLNVMPGGKQRYARVLTGEHPRARAVAPALSALLRPAISAALRGAEVWRAFTLSPRLRCTPTTFEDPMIDALWARRPGHLLLGERSAAMLRWRYGGAGRGDWNICLSRTPSGQVVGMLVWRLNGGMAEVGDFYCVDPERQTASMLNEFCRFARARGAHSISLEFFGAQAVIDQITRAGLRSRQEASIVVTDVAAADTPELAEAERWYLTEFDNDAD